MKINFNKFNNSNILFTEKTLKQFQKEKKEQEKKNKKELLKKLREEYLSDSSSEDEEEKDETLTELFFKLNKLKTKKSLIKFTIEHKEEINSLSEHDKSHILENIQKKLLFI